MRTMMMKKATTTTAKAMMMKMMASDDDNDAIKATNKFFCEKSKTFYCHTLLDTQIQLHTHIYIHSRKKETKSATISSSRSSFFCAFPSFVKQYYYYCYYCYYY